MSIAARPHSAPAQIIAAPSLCACGDASAPRRARPCSPPAIDRTPSKIIGPPPRGIDIVIGLPAVASAEHRSQSPATSSAAMRGRTLAARALQSQRFARRACHNTHMTPRQIRHHRHLNATCHKLVKSAWGETALCARAHDRSSVSPPASPTSTPATSSSRRTSPNPST